MRRIVFNDSGMENPPVSHEAIRVKAFVINNKNEVLMAHNNHTYQLIGGHVEEDEDMEKAIIRELKEETGITDFEIDGPFMLIENYTKNDFDREDYVHSKIYYYRILTDAKPDLSLTNYDVLEMQTEFKLFYVNIYNLQEFLTDAVNNDKIEKIIYKEMLLVIDEFIKLYGGDPH